MLVAVPRWVPVVQHAERAAVALPKVPHVEGGSHVGDTTAPDAGYQAVSVEEQIQTLDERVREESSPRAAEGTDLHVGHSGNRLEAETARSAERSPEDSTRQDLQSRLGLQTTLGQQLQANKLVLTRDLFRRALTLCVLPFSG